MIISLERGRDEVFASTRLGAFIHQSGGFYRQHARQRVHCLAGSYDRYAIDGFIAKKFNQITILGSYLDPLADKILIVSSILILGFIGIIPSWLLILIVSRDLAIFGAVIISWLMESDLKIEPIFSSKINTFLQILYIGLILLNLSDFTNFSILESTIIPYFSIIIGFFTSFSWSIYLVLWLKNIGIISKR